MEKQKKQKICKRFGIVFVIVCYMLLIIASPFLGSLQFASAEDVVYSNVLIDLQKDENFNLDNFPVVEKDYSLKVIQIAESSAKELFVYVYQPCVEKDFRATSISISTGINDNASWKLYDLTFLSSDGVFYKYKVEDLQLKADVVRYYDISEIFRKWDDSIDKETGNDNEISEVPFKVAQQWTVCTLNGDVSYNCTETEVIEITGKYAGFLRYQNAIVFPSGNWTDAHFVAFSTEKEIENLVEAEISYTETFYKYVEASLTKPAYVATINGPTNKTVPISADDEGTMLPSHEWFPVQHNFKRIVSVDDFKKLENLKDVTEENLQDMQWVLRFAETPFSGSLNPTSMHTWYDVSEISILKLTFENEGEIYNLGVVDNKQSGDDVPDNIEKHWWDGIVSWFKGFAKGFRIFLYVVFTLVVILVVALLVKFLQWIWKIISFPFKG